MQHSKLKNTLLIMLLGFSLGANAQDQGSDETDQSAGDQFSGDDLNIKGHNCCLSSGAFSSLSVKGTLTASKISTTTLNVTGSETVGGNLTVSGCVTAPCFQTAAGVPLVSGIRSYGYAYNALGQAIVTNAAAVPVVFNTPSNTLNSGITVAGTSITVANAGVYLVNYSVLFDVINAPVTGLAMTATAQLFNATTSTLIPNTISTAFFSAGPATPAQDGTRAEVSGWALIQTTAANQILNLNVSSLSGNAVNAVEVPVQAGQAGASVEIFQLN